MRCHIQIYQNRRTLHFDRIKILVLIISGKFSGKLPTGIFDKLSDAICDKENYFSGNWGDLIKSICKIK